MMHWHISLPSMMEKGDGTTLRDGPKLASVGRSGRVAVVKAAVARSVGALLGAALLVLLPQLPASATATSGWVNFGTLTLSNGQQVDACVRSDIVDVADSQGRARAGLPGTGCQEAVE